MHLCAISHSPGHLSPGKLHQYACAGNEYNAGTSFLSHFLCEGRTQQAVILFSSRRARPHNAALQQRSHNVALQQRLLFAILLCGDQLEIKWRNMLLGQ